MNYVLEGIGLEKVFEKARDREELKVISNLSISVSPGEIVAVLGPSGCGKTTLINMAAGFIEPTKGQFLFDGQPSKGPCVGKGVIFQTPALFPWLTVKKNISFGPLNLGLSQEEIEERVDKLIEVVGLEGFQDYYPNQISGGMGQRAALARVLATKPKLLLMDEPFASLDQPTRFAMQMLMLDISERLKPGILIVTHDIDEALVMADRIYLLSAKPATVVREIISPFPRPRTIDIVGESKLAAMKREMLEMLI